MNRKIWKIVAAIAFIGAIIGGIVAYTMWNKDFEDAMSQDGIKVTADQLYKAFETNEAEANKTYVGKVVEVSGTVSEVQTDSIQRVVLTFPDAMMGGIVINIDKRHPEGIDELKTGDQATLKGFCSGFLMDVQLIDAGLVK
jgi:glycerol uptake facilitator-like aquaporin